LRQRVPATLPQDLAKRLLLAAGAEGGKATGYNVPAINALVLYIGSTAKPGGNPVGTPAMELYLRLATELDSEGRYLMLNAIANQLRYPNSHTHYFSCVLLTLFVDVKSDAAKEQITRVLLERLIVNRPHPWVSPSAWASLPLSASPSCAPSSFWLAAPPSS
jgi:CCR4-NOT transcription complex subunit 1